MSDVLFALLGDVCSNSRALRQLRTLIEAGFSVEILTFGDPGPTPLPEAKWHFLQRPTGRGPRFFLEAHRRVREVALRTSAHVYHASDLYVLAAMSAAARRHGAALVYDARECYPYTAGTIGKPWSRLFWGAVQRRHITRASLVLTVSDAIAGHMADRYGIGRPLVLHNAPAWLRPARNEYLRDRLGIPRKQTIVLHLGRLSKGRALKPLIEAAERVPEVALVFVGAGSQDAFPGPSRAQVYVLPAVPPDEVGRVAASADLGVALLEDTCLNHRYALPNKLFEYMAAGLPVVVSDLPAMATLVRDTGAGYAVPDNDVDHLAGLLQTLAGDPALRNRLGASGLHLCERLGWTAASNRFLAAYPVPAGLQAETMRGRPARSECTEADS